MSFIKNLTRDATPSLISAETEVVGDIKNANNLEIEGTIKGNLLADTITIRESGRVTGNIQCHVFNIRGNFNGIVNCEKINISDAAIVIGTLEYKFLAVDYGANINCELKRIPEEDKKS
jgi:cytoskeletal protein CcmA (bactofilin family)